jgi:hypothetical protein
MLNHDMYVREKLREIRSGAAVCAQPVAQARGKPALAPLAKPLGYALHRIGHRLEAWAAPQNVEGERRSLGSASR